jgi:MFS family permease
VLLTVGFLLVLVGIGLAALATDQQVPAVTAAVGWTVAGLGMGLGLTSLSVLVLELSPTHEQGANASALQVSDGLGSIVTIGVAGAVFASFATGRAHGATPFLVIDALTAAVCVGGALAARRVRPGGDTR